jgi:hypothetical protein
MDRVPSRMFGNLSLPEQTTLPPAARFPHFRSALT